MKGKETKAIVEFPVTKLERDWERFRFATLRYHSAPTVAGRLEAERLAQVFIKELSS